MRRALQASMPCLVLTIAAAHADDSVAPYVPTVEEDVELMLDVAGVGPGDYLIDLGSGDGRIVIAAARRGASGHGVEIEAELVETARIDARDAGLAERTAFLRGDIFEADIEAATVVALYLFPEANLMLRPKLLAELRPGTRVVSNSFTMGDWLPDVHDMSARSSGGILLWIVPAGVAGNWALDVGGERWDVTIAQAYQRIAFQAAREIAFAAAELRGSRISFTATVDGARYRFSGRADGDVLSGYAHVETAGATRLERWSARRVDAAR